MKFSFLKIQRSNFLRAIGFFFFVASSLSCAIPNLEKPECQQSRQTVKEFYSYHFGNEMKFSRENLRQRERFLTSELIKNLAANNSENDVFTTNSTDLPKAFRVGECTVSAPDKTNFEVVLFWKDDFTSRQQEIAVETVKQNDKWLISRINR